MSPGDASLEPKSNSHTGARQGQAERPPRGAHRSAERLRASGSYKSPRRILLAGFEDARGPMDRALDYARRISAYRR
jgi:hypothetical protein